MENVLRNEKGLFEEVNFKERAPQGPQIGHEDRGRFPATWNSTMEGMK